MTPAAWLAEPAVRQALERAAIAPLEFDFHMRRSGWHGMAGLLPSPGEHDAAGRPRQIGQG